MPCLWQMRHMGLDTCQNWVLSPRLHKAGWVLLQGCGEWDEALKVADKSDRINLKATHFRFAQHHEAMGDFAAATKHYQLSDTHR